MSSCSILLRRPDNLPFPPSSQQGSDGNLGGPAGQLGAGFEFRYHRRLRPNHRSNAHITLNGSSVKNSNMIPKMISDNMKGNFTKWNTTVSDVIGSL
jgi:hypothetical protein